MLDGESSSTSGRKNPTDSPPITKTGWRSFPSLRHLAAPILVFWLGLACVTAINSLLFSSTGQWYATFLAWKLGPWSAIPIPFDSSVFDLTGTGVGGDLCDWVPSLAAGLFVASILLSVLHYSLFSLAFAVYSLRGWPPYFADVCSRVSRVHLWKKCLIRGWWILPVLGGISQFWNWLYFGQSYAECGNLNADWWFHAALLLMAGLVYLRTMSRVLISTVLGKLNADERRCNGCGYLLRGLPTRVCPECGSTFAHDETPQFSLLRKSSKRRRRIMKVAWWFVFFAVITSPFWEPLAYPYVPARIASHLPGAMNPRYYWAHTGMFPLRLGAFGVLRHDKKVVVIHITEKRSRPSSVHYWRWNNWQNWSDKPSLSGMKLEEAVSLSQTTISFGEDSATITWSDWQYKWWGWLALPGPDWQFDVIPEDEAPLELRQLALEATSKPSTR